MPTPWRPAARPKPVRFSSDEVRLVAGGVEGAAGAGSGGLMVGADPGAGAATTVVSLAAGAVGRSIVPGSSARRWTRSSKDIERKYFGRLCSR